VSGLCDFDGTPGMAEFRVPTQPLQLYRLPPRDSTTVSAAIDHDCVVALKALAEDTRVRIVSLLIDSPLDVGEIATRVGISQYNASKHLRILREAGLLQAEKAGRRHLYALTEGIGRRMAEVGVLDLGCCSFQFEGGPRQSRGNGSAARPVRRRRRSTRR
jgi:DNA-binding transcriptional ArsR family regulator